ALSVTTTGSCSWTSVSNAAWIAVASGRARTGSGSVTLTVAANTGAARSGSVTVAGRTVSVSQEAAPAASTNTIAPTAQSAPPSGGAGTPIQVSTASGCAWTAASNVPWITIGTGANGIGGGSVAFTVATNTGGVRMGSLTIGGQTATVAQGAAPVSEPCSVSVSPTHDSIGADGGRGTTIAVSSPSGCSWT